MVLKYILLSIILYFLLKNLFSGKILTPPSFRQPSHSNPEPKGSLDVEYTDYEEVKDEK